MTKNESSEVSLFSSDDYISLNPTSKINKLKLPKKSLNKNKITSDSDRLR